MRATFQEFDKLGEKSVEDYISDEMSGDLKRAMLTIGRCYMEIIFNSKQ